MLRAVGTEKASEIIEYLLNSLLSASDETIFGNTFFEPIARIVSGGKVSGAEGVDFEVHKNNRISAYAVKSGTHWGNASQKKRINDEFSSLRSRLYKMYMQFDAVIGHGYGTQKNEPNSKRIFRDVSGQAFWKVITDDPYFYLKLIKIMKDEPQKHKIAFKKEWDATINKFTQEFISDFCNPEFKIDWEKLCQFVSEEDNQLRETIRRKYKIKNQKSK